MWDAVEDGTKTAEFRKNDRGFEVGDILALMRNDTPGNTRYATRVITHIVRGPAFGIPEGYAMLSLGPA
jgi:hypothetical protein